MDRADKIRQSFTKDMAIIEIGASYNPLVPKRDGWRTTTVDHADRETLVKKYTDESGRLGVGQADPDIIEEVDIVWQEGSLLDAFPAALRGTYDAVIASHVAEHIPDFLGFLAALDGLLKPEGVVFLALPDHRLCFDFFQPVTTTGHVLDSRGASRHSVGTLYDHAAYFAARGGESTWAIGGEYKPPALVHAFRDVRSIIDGQPSDYIDSHKWRFTPSSFRLLMLELNLLRLAPWAIERIEHQGAVEFFVWLKRATINLTADEINDRRVQLLQETIMESQEQIRLLDPATTRQPSISAIIPLYNGEKFIEQSLTSILQQTLPPKEIIVVDDGSTDNGAAVVTALADKHPIIRLLSKPNGGQSSARNFGVAHSSGELIALLDQDDMWYPHHLEELIKPFLERSSGPELGWVYSDLDEIDTEGRMVTHRFLDAMKLGTHPKHNLLPCLGGDMFILPSASLIRRTAFNKIDGFDERLSGYEDDDLFMRLFRAGYNNVFLEIALSQWRIFPESYSYTYRMRRSRAIYMRKLMAEYPDDATRARYLTRDLILPRFYRHALSEYQKAMKTGNIDVIEETRQELLYIVKQMPGRRKQVLARGLGMVQSPKAMQIVYAARPYLRPFLRRVV